MSKVKLEKVLSLLLSEGKDAASHLMHQYVVETCLEINDKILREDEVEITDEEPETSVPSILTVFYKDPEGDCDYDQAILDTLGKEDFDGAAWAEGIRTLVFQFPCEDEADAAAETLENAQGEDSGLPDELTTDVTEVDFDEIEEDNNGEESPLTDVDNSTVCEDEAEKFVAEWDIETDGSEEDYKPRHLICVKANNLIEKYNAEVIRFENPSKLDRTYTGGGSVTIVSAIFPNKQTAEDYLNQVESYAKSLNDDSVNNLFMASLYPATELEEEVETPEEDPEFSDIFKDPEESTEGKVLDLASEIEDLKRQIAELGGDDTVAESYELETVKPIDNQDGELSGDAGKIKTNDKSVIPGNDDINDRAASAKPMEIGKGEDHKGYERQPAPPVKVLDNGTNIRKSGTEGYTKVSKEGDAKALINQTPKGNDKSVIA